MLAELTAATFKEGDILSVDLGKNNAYPLTLEKIALPKSKGRNGQRAPFALVFKGSSVFFLRQGTHVVTHQALGIFQLFLVPIAPYGDGGHYYEACFS